MNGRRRVIIASNRVPPPPAEGAPWPAGGLVSALLPPLAAVGGLWFGWSGQAGDPDTPPQRTVTSDIDYVTIDLPAQEIADYYEGFSNRTLWPHLHGLTDQATSRHLEYSTYLTANRRFARALIPLLGADDLIWVHDYQLIPLGRELQRLGWRGPLGYFHHVPVPPREHWEAIPNYEDLAASFTAYELIGTQTPRDRDQLRALLPAAHGEHVSAHPVGIDPQRFRQFAASYGSDPLAREGDERQILFGVDRLDYTKGIPQRLEAFERLLLRDERWRHEARFVQWAAPSRDNVPEYQAERAAVIEVAERINARFGEPHPVELDLTSHPPDEVAAGLQAADICVVTSLADGMNLVAKEFAAVHSAAASQHPGVLVRRSCARCACPGTSARAARRCCARPSTSPRQAAGSRSSCWSSNGAAPAARRRRSARSAASMTAPGASAAPALSWTRTAAAAGAAMSAQPPSLPNIPGRVEIDPVEQVMHEFPYGIYIVGSVEDGEPNGMIADWVMQVSFEPRLVAVAFEDDSRSLARIRANGVFTVNLLTEEPDSMELARQFLQPYDASKIKGRSDAAAAQRHHKLEGVEHWLRDSGCPVLEDALAWLECEAEQFVEAGDHVLVIGRVLDGEVLVSAEPLTSLYTGWTYSG